MEIAQTDHNLDYVIVYVIVYVIDYDIDYDFNYDLVRLCWRDHTCRITYSTCIIVVMSIR